MVRSTFSSFHTLSAVDLISRSLGNAENRTRGCLHYFTTMSRCQVQLANLIRQDHQGHQVLVIQAGALLGNPSGWLQATGWTCQPAPTKRQILDNPDDNDWWHLMINRNFLNSWLILQRQNKRQISFGFKTSAKRIFNCNCLNYEIVQKVSFHSWSEKNKIANSMS